MLDALQKVLDAKLNFTRFFFGILVLPFEFILMEDDKTKHTHLALQSCNPRMPTNICYVM